MTDKVPTEHHGGHIRLAFDGRNGIQDARRCAVRNAGSLRISRSEKQRE